MKFCCTALHRLDNLHEYLRFSFPNIKAPSFFCVNESKVCTPLFQSLRNRPTRQIEYVCYVMGSNVLQTGLTLQYRTRRVGYNHYVRGIIKGLASDLYRTSVKIDIVCESEVDGAHNVIFRLHFDNSVYTRKQQAATMQNDSLPVPSRVFFQAFPFNLVINRGMKIMHIGSGLHCIMPELKVTTSHSSFTCTQAVPYRTAPHSMLFSPLLCTWLAGQGAHGRLPPASTHHLLHLGICTLH